MLRIVCVALWVAVLAWGGARGAGSEEIDSEAARPRVERWGRFEVVVPRAAGAAPEPTGRSGAPAPGDLRLEARFTRPDGSEVDFWGFHDGARGWRLRFMPDRVGTWRYQARFSDGRPGVRGRFECVASQLPGVLRPLPSNPIWFALPDGSPWLVRSFHVGDRFFAANWPAAQRTAFLDWAERQGYNTLSVASLFLNRDSPGRGRGWQTPDLWDAAARRPRPEGYRALEAILDRLARRRLYVFPFAGFFGQSSDFPTDPADQERYLRYTLARIGPYWNLLFNVGGPDALARPERFGHALGADDIARLGRRIAALDVFDHPLSVHNPPGPDAFRAAAWLDFSTLQGGAKQPAALHRFLLDAAQGVEKPVLAHEVLWAGNRSQGTQGLGVDALRRGVWAILMAGASYNFGDMDGSSSSGFSGSLDVSRRSRALHDALEEAWDLFATLPFGRLRPAPSRVDRGFCLADPGRTYVVFLPGGGGVALDAPPGRYAVTWIDATDPERREDGGFWEGGALRAPGTDRDWLARIERH